MTIELGQKEGSKKQNQIICGKMILLRVSCVFAYLESRYMGF
jgi:hypothetical protein